MSISGTVFMIIHYLDMYHDTVFIGGVFPCCSAVARALLCVSCRVFVLQTNTLFPEVSSRDSLS